MINKIGINQYSNINSFKARSKQEDLKQNNSPNFKGLGAIMMGGIQACERMPMLNVTIIDSFSGIIPRSIIESTTNWFAGFEALRRESTGLIVNCLIPGFITLGIAKVINKLFMGKGSNMSNCWADRAFIDKLKDVYNNSNGNKVNESFKNIIGNIQGVESNNNVIFKDALSPEDIEKYSSKLTNISRSTEKDSVLKKQVGKIASEIVEKTRISQNITVGGGNSKVQAASVASALEDAMKFFKEFQKVEGKQSIEEFAKRSKKLVTAKSGLAFAVILPLAMSMQYINRWITCKISGVKGAPIYDDFGKGDANVVSDPKSKKGLLKQKLISISSMLGVSLLSMMKKPSWNMFEFKGKFPTMDQARIISTATFSSRMGVAEDKNELAEATVRDIATFSSLYFLGDYAAKGAATAIQNSTGVLLLNDTKKIDKNANPIKKLWHWVKDVNIKASDEVVSKTEEMLKKQGLQPTKEQLVTIEKEIKKARNLRSACQVTNLGVSLALLGIVIPVFTRKSTKKKHEQDKLLAQANSTTQTDKNNQKSDNVTPLNVKYSKLTTGFRADRTK